MAHPLLQAWKQEGTIAIAVCRDGAYHIVTDDLGRRSLYDLLSRFEQIDYHSSVRIALVKAPEIHIDLNIEKKQPMWFTEIKLAGSRDETLITLETESHVLSVNKSLWQSVFSKPNHGYDEANIGTESQVWAW